MNKTIHIGNSPNAPFLAYGDESKKGDVIVYAYVIFNRKHERDIERQIRYIKKEFGLPFDFPLHCKVLTHGDALKKNGLNHLTGYDGLAIIRRVVSLFNAYEMEIRYAYESLQRAVANLGSEIVLRDQAGEPVLVQEITHSYQGHLGILSVSCLVNPRGIPANMCQFFAGEEDSRMKFIGPKAERTDSRYNGFSDIGAPRGSVFHIQPKLIKAGSHFGLELADVAAYLCVNALQPGEPQKPFFKEQLARIKIWTSSGSPIIC